MVFLDFLEFPNNTAKICVCFFERCCKRLIGSVRLLYQLKMASERTAGARFQQRILRIPSHATPLHVVFWGGF